MFPTEHLRGGDAMRDTKSAPDNDVTTAESEATAIHSRHATAHMATADL
jgi:hypothetical protein